MNKEIKDILKECLEHVKEMAELVDGEWGYCRSFKTLCKEEGNNDSIKLYRKINKVLEKK